MGVLVIARIFLDQKGYMMMMQSVVACLLVATLATTDILLHVEEKQQDRVFCSLSTQSACVSACNGQACTETCIATCGVFSRPFNYLCSAVAASTCSAATTVAATTAPAADAPFTV